MPDLGAPARPARGLASLRRHGVRREQSAGPPLVSVAAREGGQRRVQFLSWGSEERPHHLRVNDQDTGDHGHDQHGADDEKAHQPVHAFACVTIGEQIHDALRERTRPAGTVAVQPGDATQDRDGSQTQG
jgi:hypothetical protein